MACLQPVRGTHDILPKEFRLHRFIGDLAASTAERFGFEEIATPIFEFSEVFERTLGDTSDIVTKEMYTFQDKSGESLTLRPEGTAGVSRMIISNGLTQKLPLKYFYRGPMFRYERPQKGRYRQFHQIGVELLGISQPQADVEVIALANMLLKALKLSGNITLEINTLGNVVSRNHYRKVLVDFFNDHRADLSEDSILRLDKNPLRILDSKDPGDRKLVERAPNFNKYLDSESEIFFASVCRKLDALSISYHVNERLVRGLDYYGHTAFEFKTDALGAQGTVLAGGRYDGLIAQMGGQETPGVGWAAGLERLSLLIKKEPTRKRPIAIIPVATEQHDLAISIANRMREEGYNIELAYQGNLTKRLKRANRLSCRAAVILGGDELERGKVAIRDLDSGGQMEAEIEALSSSLSRFNSDY
ncbi:MAG: histidine--tRNA ligase [Pseudomonadota bacterium]|nr:histidine--tRNA ligase [Pseudomonadota bacterium]